ncbi:M-phase inducer phosphatase 1-B-like [Liolophura sinensis]|uniref:M-phase inducer phosphatase 1-B-like n=1 Tax=Liolophura sinensis TaxID=3198878 RepID=UPI0031598C0C
MLLTSTPVKRPKMKLSFPLSPFVTKDTTSNDGDGSFYNTEKPYWIVGPVVSMVQYPRLEVDSPVAGPVHDQAASNVTPKESNSQWKSSPHFGGPFSLGSSPMKTHIDAAVARADSNPDLIGDGTFTFCLPTVPGKHQDLKSITSETLTKVINHEYDHILEKYVIIDCRYPYEYDGGHIQGSENVYTRDALIERFIKGAALSKTEGRRKVLIFHCEFSTERAPKLLRYLRNQDREHNVTRYPSLYYPEVYVLLDGYKAFFYSHKELCTPQSYQPMNDELFEEELWKFRNEAKHWSGDKNKRGLIKTRLSALKAVYTC